jgi:hypothetical protein
VSRIKGNGKRSLRRPKLPAIKGSSVPEEEEGYILILWMNLLPPSSGF